jgi:carbon-monoxide dehydrogenase small subunit
MTAFELVEPSSLDEALRLLDPNDPGVRPIAGGTALMLMMKTGLYRPRCLVSLRALGPALTTIAATPDGGLDVLRDRFALGGPRESCGQGLCGCCTVLVDNAAVSSCLYLAVFADGAEVVTVEGLADGDTLHPVQEAFIEAGAFQCGFCTPGFVLMTTQLLAAHPDPSDDQIRHYLSGNLCRCGTYPQIVEAVKLAGRKLRVA